MKAQHILFACLFLAALASTAFPSPMSHTLAINPSTGECGIARGGDENIYYDLPDGWNEYYFDRDQLTRDNQKPVLVYVTPYGTCNDTLYEMEKCCRQLGLKYVGDGNVGKGHIAPGMLVFGPNICCFPFAIVLAIIIYMSIRKSSAQVLAAGSSQPLPRFLGFTASAALVKAGGSVACAATVTCFLIAFTGIPALGGLWEFAPDLLLWSLAFYLLISLLSLAWKKSAGRFKL